MKKILNEQQLRKHISSEVKKMMMEDAEPSKIDSERFPLTLSAAKGVKNMPDYVTKGKEDKKEEDDVVAVKEGVSFSCSDLKPSQTSMNIEKAMGMALNMLKSGKAGGDLGAFISNDNYIMDGHHRWISTAMVDPSAKIVGNLVNLPGKELVAVLNALTAGKFKHEGKPATGGFDQFKPAPIKAELEKCMKEGVGGDFAIEASEVQKIVKKFGGSLNGAVKKFVKNLSGVTMATPSWAPERPDMPVIEKGDSDDAKSALAGGEVDVNPPYATGSGETSGDKKDVQKSGYYRSGDVVLERWQKMAGIIK